MKNMSAYELAAQDIRNRSEKAYAWYIGLPNYKVSRTEDPETYRVEEPNGTFFETIESICFDLEMAYDAANNSMSEYHQTEAYWYQEEKKQYGSNGPVIAHDSYTGKHDKTFDSYDAFRREWPGAEIVGHDMQETGKGCIVYC